MSTVVRMAIALLGLSVAGCADLMRPDGLPDGLLVVPAPPDPGGASGRIIVYRDNSFTGTINYRWVAVDGQVVARLATSQRVEISTAPGVHEVSVYCYAWWSWRESKWQVDVAEGRVVSYLLKPKIPNCAAVQTLGAEEAASWRDRTTPVEVGPPMRR